MLRKLLVLTALVALVISAGSTTAQARRASDSRTSKGLVYTHDFITATNIVGKYYGSNVERWLVSCSSGEGGHGGFVWFGHHTYAIYGRHTPGGNMQFMESTWDSNSSWAFQDAAQRGLKIHPRAKSYYEPLGQAVVAAAIYKKRGNPGTWTGGGC